MVPESIVQAVAAAPQSEVRAILLAMWGFNADLTPVAPEAQNEAYKQLEAILASAQEMPF